MKGRLLFFIITGAILAFLLILIGIEEKKKIALTKEVKQPIDPVREQIIGRYATVRLDGGCEFIINTYWGSTQAVHHPKCDNHWYSILK